MRANEITPHTHTTQEGGSRNDEYESINTHTIKQSKRGKQTERSM